MPEKIGESDLTRLKELVARPVFQRGVRPLNDGTRIAIHIGDAESVTLIKRGGVSEIILQKPETQELSFWIPTGALAQLSSVNTEDIGDVGVELLKLMVHSDPNLRVSMKVHIGVFDLWRLGYLSVIPQGGPAVMKFLSERGFGSLGKIKETLTRMRSEK